MIVFVRFHSDGHNDTVHLAGNQGFDKLYLLFQPIIGLTNNNPIPVFKRQFLYAPNQGGEKKPGYMGHDNTDCLGFLAPEIGGQSVSLVTKLFGFPLNQIPCFFVDSWTIGQCPGNRGTVLVQDFC